MANLENLQQKDIELDLSQVPANQRTAVKEAVGNYVVDQILSMVGDGTSPVTGEPFQTLTEKYADEQKGGNDNPNLELEGDMLASLGFRNTSDGIAVGIMDPSQRPKADGHNHLTKESIRSNNPERRFIAAGNQDFVPEIMTEISKIISEFEPPPEQPAPITERGLIAEILGFSTRPAPSPDENSIGITLSDLIFSEDIITKLFSRIK